MTTFLLGYYVLAGIVVVPVLMLGEYAQWSEEQTMKSLWWVLTRRILP